VPRNREHANGSRHPPHEGDIITVAASPGGI
jgi:hypothetical protein